MADSSEPLPFSEWSDVPVERAEDAANAFGYELIRRCRVEALEAARKQIAEHPDSSPMAAVEEAVDTALHNVADLLEGFWRVESGPQHRLEYSLSVVVRGRDNDEVESVRISPAYIDLPIGYWKWRDGDFR